MTSQTITVAILNDAVFENSETFTVNLSSPVNATIADNSGLGTIRDDGTGLGGTDSDIPTLSVSNVSATEGSDTHAVFTVSLSNASTTPVSVSLALANGTALGGGVDFGPGLEVSTDNGTTWNAATSATIAPGSTHVLVRTPIINDTLSEAAENFTLTATRTAGTTTNAAATGTAIIVDNDALPGLVINDVTVNEGAGTATFTVTLGAASGQTVTVGYATNGGTATSGADFVAESGTLTFAPGTTTQTITVPILNDSTFENSEAFTVTLSGAVNATITDATGVGTIRDDGTGLGGTDNDIPTLSMSVPVATEGVNPFAIFTVGISNPSTTDITFDLALANGTAIGGGVDFGAGLEVSTNGGTTWTPATRATIVAGTTSLLVRTPITDDALNEAPETFMLTATRTAGTTSNLSFVGTETIADNDAPPSLSINDVTVNEGAGTATFTVTLGAPSGQTVSVNYATGDGTAIAGVDYIGESGTVTFAPGVTTRTISVPIVNDSTFAQSENFTISLSGAVNATIADPLGVGTILDDGTGAGGTDDDRPSLNVSDVTVVEGGAQPNAVFTVSLSNASTTDVTVNLALANGTATGGGVDFGTAGAGNLQVSTDNGTTWNDATTATIAAGTTSVLVRTPIVDDSLNESAENFTLTATRTAGTTTNVAATGTASIIDDDGAPTLSIDDVTVNEATGTATFTVSLSAPSGLPVSVSYTTANGTATGGADFTATSGVLNFAPGALTRTITVPILDDTIFENSEAFTMVLSAPTNATIADGSGLGTIRDDGTGTGGTNNDTPSFSVSNAAVTEGTDTHAVFTLSLSNQSTTPVNFNLALANGTALGGGIDYGTGGAGNLQVSTDNGVTWNDATTATIAANTTGVLVRTPITNDTLNEAAETFRLTATRTAGTTTNTVSTGTATITDDDPTPSLSINDVTVNEAAGTATFTVTLGAPSGQTVTANYATSAGSATSGADFAAASGTLTFAPGVTTQTVSVSILNDDVYEVSETFLVALTAPVNATIAHASGTGTIRDDGTGAGGTDNDTPTLAVSDINVVEGTDSFAVFNVGLSNPSKTPVSVSLALTNGSATGGGVDYGATGAANIQVSTDGGTTWNNATTATLAAGATSVLVRTPIINDVLFETLEDFTLAVTRTAGSTTNASVVATARIADNDGTPALSINNVTVNEGAGTATFNVTLSAPAGLNVTVNYATASGTATSGADFTGKSGSLTFTPGVTSQTVTVSILNDSIFEHSEKFTVTLSGAVNASIADGSGVGTILDDGTGAGGTDNDTPTLSVSSPVVTEGTNPFGAFTVSLSNPSTVDVNFNLALAEWNSDRWRCGLWRGRREQSPGLHRQRRDLE